MKLASYLDAKEITRRAFADLIGVSEVAICRYINGDRVPRRKEMARIIDVTGGEVTPNDFMLIPASSGAAA